MSFRIFSRTLPIPFGKREGSESIGERIEGRQKFEETLSKTPRSVGVMIKLHGAYKTMTKDPLFKDIGAVVQNEGLDVRSEANFAVLPYSTGKVTILS